jgi:maltose-binding protein MalE
MGGFVMWMFNVLQGVLGRRPSGTRRVGMVGYPDPVALPTEQGGRMLKRKLVAAVSLTLALMALSACGGSSSATQTQTQTQARTHPTQAAAFTIGHQAATAELEQISRAIGAAIEQAPNSSNAQLAQTFRDLAGRWQAQVSALEALTPPSDLAAQFNTLKDAVARVETDLNAIVSASETNNKSAAEQAAASLVSDIAATRAADAPIRKQLGLK